MKNWYYKNEGNIRLTIRTVPYEKTLRRHIIKKSDQLSADQHVRV